MSDDILDTVLEFPQKHGLFDIAASWSIVFLSSYTFYSPLHLPPTPISGLGKEVVKRLIFVSFLAQTDDSLSPGNISRAATMTLG